MTFDFHVVLPILVVAAYGLLVLVLTPAFRGSAQLLGVASLVGLGLSAYFALRLFGANQHTAYGMVLIDDFSLFFDLIFLIAGAIGILASMQYLDREGAHHGEYYALILFAVAGMMTMVSTDNLLVIFLGLELLSIPLYVLSGFTREKGRAVEAALKYFLLGAFSTGIILYGMAFVYGATGSLGLSELSDALSAGLASRAMFGVGAGLVLVGLCFKIAAVPFHSWVPDVYQGAPTPVVAIMAAGTKAAAFGALLRIVHTGFPAGSSLQWSKALILLAVLTMTVGNLVALTQHNIKRMLAYSSIAHAGYLLIAVVSPVESGVQSAAFYLLSYTFMTMGAFIVAAIVGRGGQGEKGYALAAYAGLGRRRPALAAAMTIFMFSLTGLPPTAGFVGKLFVFKAAVEGHLYVLAAIGLLNSAIAAYYYLSPVVAMWMRPEVEGTEPERSGAGLVAAVAISVIATLLLGLYSAPFLEIASTLSQSL